jgi:hypothetical protein
MFDWVLFLLIVIKYYTELFKLFYLIFLSFHLKKIMWIPFKKFYFLMSLRTYMTSLLRAIFNPLNPETNVYDINL